MSRATLLALAAVSLMGAPVAAQTDDATTSAPTAKFTVVTGKGPGAPNLKRPVAKNVERKLKVFGETVPFARYRKAARQEGIRKPKELTEVSTARTVGPALGLTHVIIIESVREREQVGKRKKNVFYAEVSVVEVASGDVVMTNRYQLAGRRLNLGIGVDMVDAIGPVLQPPEPEPEPEPAEDPIALAPFPPPPPAEGEAAADPNADPMAPPPPPEDPVAEPEPESLASNEPEPTSSSFEILGGENEVEDTYEPRSRRRRGGRPGLELLVGPTFLTRTGTVSAGNVPDDINYDGPMLGASLELAFYPLSFGGKGDFIEGLGLYGRGLFSQVTTEFDPNDPDQTVDSTIFSGEGGLALRIPFGDDRDDVSMGIVLGYAYWQFPLSDGVFPGVKYDGPYAQLGFDIPFIEEFSFFFDGGVIPLLNTDGRTKRLNTLDSGLAYNANAGFKLKFDPFDIRLVGHYRAFTASYTGTSRLGLVTELENAELSDTYLGGSLMLGIALD